MTITKEEIEKRRTPKDLHAFIVRKHEEINTNTSERHKGMLKKELYKEFIDEIMPLANCAYMIYPENVTIQPVLGNQGYDAVVFDTQGNELEKIEVTVPKFGDEIATDSRLVVSEGIGRVKIWSPGDLFKELIPRILEVARNKAIKDYSDCKLIIIVNTDYPASESERPNILKLADQLIMNLKQISFQARRVLLNVVPLHRVFAIQS